MVIITKFRDDQNMKQLELFPLVNFFFFFFKSSFIHCQLSSFITHTGISLIPITKSNLESHTESFQFIYVKTLIIPKYILCLKKTELVNCDHFIKVLAVYQSIYWDKEFKKLTANSLVRKMSLLIGWLFNILVNEDKKYL